MSRKDIIVMSVLINVGLIIILLVSSLTTKESYFVASSAKVAGSILESNEDGMLSSLKTEGKEAIGKKAVSPLMEKSSELPFVKLEDPKEVIHKLPALSLTESIEQQKETVLQKPKKNMFMEVTVKKGDSLEKIAKANNTSVSNIVKINELSNTFLKVGQTLLVPKIEGLANKSIKKKDSRQTNISTETNYYTVKCGDNPWTIAMKHHMKVEELLKLNNLDSATAKKLRPGDKLRIK